MTTTVSAPIGSITGTEASTLAGQYLTFGLGAEEYGVAIGKVQEIIAAVAVTAVPAMPAFALGVINLRGKVVPVIDLRQKLGMRSTDVTPESCIVITRTANLGVGLLVDRVSEVLTVQSANIEPPPATGSGLIARVLLGIAKTGASVKLLLNLDGVVEDSEANAIHSAIVEHNASDSQAA